MTVSVASNSSRRHKDVGSVAFGLNRSLAISTVSHGPLPLSETLELLVDGV